MKTSFRFLAPFAAVLALVALTGCNTVSTTTNQALGVPTFPPNMDPASIQILTTPPTRPHVRLGDIQAEPYRENASAATITLALQKAAAKLGADAVVIVSDRNQVMGAIVTGPWYGRSVQAMDQRVIVGVAIKYQ
jgi:hypothetical protein